MSANCDPIEGCLGEKGGFSIFPMDPSADLFYFSILIACLLGVYAAFFLELLLLNLPYWVLFSDYFLDDDLLVFNCLLLSTEIFPASSISNGVMNFAIS